MKTQEGLPSLDGNVLPNSTNRKKYYKILNAVILIYFGFY